MRVAQWLYKLPLLLRSLFHRRDVEQELDEEIRFHVEQQIKLNVAQGMSEHDARKAALRAFGNIDARKEDCRDNWVVSALDRLSRDFRHAQRALRRDGVFTLGVFALLTLGIGANVAVFSIVNSILFEPLPYEDPDRLFVVREAIPERGGNPSSVNALHYLEWTQCDCLEDIALSDYALEANLAGEGDPARVSTIGVTANAFAMLGVVPQAGRVFVAEDGEPGASNVVLISDELWRTNFGSDPDIVGKTINLDAVPSVVVGVLPPDFRYYAFRSTAIDVYRPWSVERMPWWTWTNNYSYTALARLADGVSAQSALQQLDAIQAGIAREHFEGGNASLSLEARIFPLKDWVTSRSREGLYLLFAAVSATLLVACLNTANLMLVRATARSREAGIRTALGATRLAIFRSMFIESAILAGAGTAAGVLLAGAVLGVLKSVATGLLPRMAEVEMDWTVLIAAALLAVVTTLSFGLFPALRLTRVDPQASLQAHGRASTDSRGRQLARQTLVSAEVGVSVTLLVVSGLLLMSFVRLDNVDRGFDPSAVLTAEVGLPQIRYQDNESRLRFWNALLDELGAAPGVVSAGLTSSLPLRGNNWGSTALREGENPPAVEHPSVQYRFVSGGYLSALGIPVIAGRALTREDYGGNSAVISRQLARLLWNDANAIGRRFHWNDPELLFEVVGVVPDVHSQDLATDPAPIVYRPITGGGNGSIVMGAASIAIRTTGDPATAIGFLRSAVASLDKELSISKVQTMRQVEAASLGDRRFQLTLVGAFGLASLLIAGIGIYSVLAYAVNMRTRELAIRMALGAQRARIMSLVIRQGMKPVLLGLCLGIPVAIGVGRMISSLLYSVRPSDAMTFGAVVVVTLAAALFASVVPARRAVKTSLLSPLGYD